MKTLFTIPMIIMIAITGVVSCYLFQNENYNLSALLTLASFVSINLLIAVLNSKKLLLK